MQRRHFLATGAACAAALAAPAVLAQGGKPDAAQVHARLPHQRPDRALLPGREQGLLQGRRPRRHDRHRRRLGGFHHADRQRRLPARPRRHQLAGRVQCPEPGHPDGAGGLPVLQPRTVRDHRPQGPRRRAATSASLQGKKVAAAAVESTRRAWPMVARKQGMKPDAFQWQTTDFSARDNVMVRGDVDAATYFHDSAISLFARMKAEELSVLKYADAGVDLYGNAILAEQQPDRPEPEGGGGLPARHQPRDRRDLRQPGAQHRGDAPARTDPRCEDRARPLGHHGAAMRRRAGHARPWPRRHPRGFAPRAAGRRGGGGRARSRPSPSPTRCSTAGGAVAGAQ